VKRLARPLLYVGVVAIVFGLARFHAGREHYDLTDSFRFSWTVAYCCFLLVASYGAGLPDLPRTGRQAVTSTVLAVVVAVLGISFLQLITGSALLPRLVVFGAPAPVVLWGLVCTAVAHGGRVRNELRDRIVLVSEAAEAVALRDELAGSPERSGTLVDHLAPGELQPTHERSKPLVERAVAAGANVLVLDRTALADPVIVDQAAALHEAGLRVRTLSLFYDEWLGKLPMSELERTSLLFDIRELHGQRYARAKRVVDLGLGLLASLVLLLLVPIVVIGNLLGNRGPLFYRQLRVGKLGRPFTILKFRTMRSSDDAEGPSWTQQNDARVTRFGRLLRVSHLDELPQALNVLRGDLSIVGPRPEQPHYVNELVEKLPFYDMRHLVRPGLTGWAQVKYGYAGDETDTLEKLQYEFWYLSHQSLALDARIIGRTIRSVAGGEGAGR
jgi:lipopolysaccharide/colanic/teichoic acid biosynthesis glycosyltransferase